MVGREQEETMNVVSSGCGILLRSGVLLEEAGNSITFDLYDHNFKAFIKISDGLRLAGPNEDPRTGDFTKILPQEDPQKLNPSIEITAAPVAPGEFLYQFAMVTSSSQHPAKESQLTFRLSWALTPEKSTNIQVVRLQYAIYWKPGWEE